MLKLLKVLILTVVVVLLVASCGKPQAEERVTVPPGAPRAVLRVARRSEAQMLEDTIRQYALEKGFRQCPVPHYEGFYSGPGYPRVLYKDDRFAIWALGPGPMTGPMGVFHMAPYTTSYTSQEFERFTNSVVEAAARDLHVQLNPTNYSQW